MTVLNNPGLTAAWALELSALTHAPAAAWQARQQVRLQQIVAHARRNSPFYAQHLADLDVDVRRNWSGCPPLRREELMANFNHWVTDPRVRREEAEAFMARDAQPPDGGGLAEPWMGRYMLWQSSGSSGSPGLFVQDSDCMALYDALEACRRSPPRPWLHWLDPLCLTQRMAFVGVLGGHFASIVSIERLRRIHPWLARALRCFSIMQPTPSLLAQLAQWRPSILACYPSVAALLLDADRHAGLGWRPAEVWLGGESLSPALRRRLQQHWGCAVRASYGSSEFLCMAWECDAGQLHLNADCLLLEPVDARGKPVAQGQWSEAALLTHLGNRIQPLIRYWMDDRIRYLSEPCCCGCSLPVIELEGRQDDVLQMRAASGARVELLPLALVTVLEEDAGVFDFQLLRRGERALTLCLPAHPKGADTAHGEAQGERARQALIRFAHQQGLDGLAVELAFSADWPPAWAQGASGKRRRVRAERPQT